VRLAVVRRLEDGGEPGRLAVGRAGKLAGEDGLDLLLLALDLADTEALVLWLLEDLDAVQAEEEGSRVLAGWVVLVVAVACLE
jgi:hypothetical protein